MSQLLTSTAGQQRRTRRFARKEVNVDAEFSPVNIKLNAPHNLGTIHGSIKNLSPAGIYAELPVLYRVGTRFQARIQINGTNYSFYAIVWRVDLKHDVNKPTVYGHGMKITTASDDTVSAIMNYLAN